MQESYEIEIKTLLGLKVNADKLKSKILAKGGILVPEKSSKQLNHYFQVKDLSKLEAVIAPHLSEQKIVLLKKIIAEGKNISLRTREANGKVLFVVKASIDDHSSSNGVARVEFEEPMQMTLDELDKLLLSAGLTYQAKWSREREEFKFNDTSITVDKNAGYGYLAEFERVISDKTLADSTKKDLLALMSEFDVAELMQDRLERMFDYYNKNWEKYYGTDNVFVIE